jgi:hypothetical protein
MLHALIPEKYKKIGSSDAHATGRDSLYFSSITRTTTQQGTQLGQEAEEPIEQTTGLAGEQLHARKGYMVER